MAPDPAGDSVTLGEVYRGLVEVKDATRENTREMSRLGAAVEVGRDKTGRLEMIVYGTGAMASAALITAVLSLIQQR